MTVPPAATPPTPSALPHRVSVVIPVYQGEQSLPAVVEELLPFTGPPRRSPQGRPYVVEEIVLVHDCGPDGSARVLRELAAAYDVVRVVWLSRNFGQHAATLAGISATGGEWVVTMDEDGQHDPAHIGAFIDTALTEQADVVYAQPTNAPPHGAARNAASRGAKWLVRQATGNTESEKYHSYRLILGEIARSLAAYAGPGIYLDVAVTWVARRIARCPLPMRAEQGRASGYHLRSLASHFWRLVLSSGTRPLRWVSLTGIVFAVGSLLASVLLVAGRLLGQWSYPGWTSTLVILLFCTGAILASLGVIAEFVGVAVNMAMGKPLYLPVRDRADGPLGRG